MKKRINLTIDSDIYDVLDKLPRKASVSEFVSLMLRGYVETAKAGRELTQEEVDAIVDRLGGDELRERLRNTFGPSFERIDAGVQWVKRATKLDKEKEGKKK